MIEPTWFLLGALLPAAGTGLVLWIASRWLKVDAAWSFALGAGFVVTYWATNGWPPWPPRESHHWLVVAVVPIVFIAELIGGWGRAGRWLGWLLRVVVLMGWAPLLFQSYLKYNWSQQQAWCWLGALGAVGAVEFATVVGVSRRDCHKLVVVALGLIAVATGILLMLSGSATLGQIGLGLACVLGGGCLTQMLKSDVVIVTGLLGALVLLMGLWGNGYFYASLTPLRVVCLMIAPLGLWVGVLPSIRRCAGLVRYGAVIAAIMLPLVVALMDAGLAFSAEMNNPSVPY